MSDLASGRYADSEEEWLLDGSPSAPYRRTISRRDITSTVTLATTNTLMYVYAVPVQAGDVFNYITLAVKTAPTGTVAHSWVALYAGVATGSVLLAQSADVTTGFTTGGLKLQLGSQVQNVGTVGTPQGPSTAATTVQGPAVWGIAVYGPGSSAGSVLDGMAAGSVTGEQVLTGQMALASSGTITAGATAPAVLPTMTALAGTTTGGGLPYIVLSRT